MRYICELKSFKLTWLVRLRPGMEEIGHIWWFPNNLIFSRSSLANGDYSERALAIQDVRAPGYEQRSRASRTGGYSEHYPVTRSVLADKVAFTDPHREFRRCYKEAELLLS